jgi:NAD(P)-dependent dehydrogenase (short-subunit alcohol dehydrogenase family)
MVPQSWVGESKVRRKLQGQVALITGAGRGIGAAAARMLAEAGAAVVLTARSQDQIEEVAREIRQAGQRAIAVPGDVSDVDQIEEMVESALDQFDRVDILINNAGVLWPMDETIDADFDEWAYNIHVNLVGAFYLSRSVLPVMVDQRYGRILNISSGAAVNPRPGWSAYCAAKAGLEMFTRTLALELAGTGITVNALRPGLVDTEMQAEIRSVDTSESSLNFDRFHEAYTRGELRPPEEVAEPIYWLVGPWSRDHSGEIFTVGDESWTTQVARDLGL